MNVNKNVVIKYLHYYSKMYLLYWHLNSLHHRQLTF